MFRALERSMAMDDAAWQRHANPWSVFTRFSILPLLALAVWSREWIGAWSLAAVALVALWTWYNPRAFGPPHSTDNWASKGVMGERLFLARKSHPVPRHHERMALLLAALSFVGIVILVHGLAVLQFWTVTAGLVLAMATKAWFIDRMVWLYEDMSRPSAIGETTGVARGGPGGA